jgi:hypothetical protein
MSRLSLLLLPGLLCDATVWRDQILGLGSHAECHVPDYGSRASLTAMATRPGPPVYDDILDMIERRTPAIFEAQIGALLSRPDATSVFEGLVVPTLVACGRDDQWSPRARYQQMAALIPGARLAVIERLWSHDNDGAARSRDASPAPVDRRASAYLSLRANRCAVPDAALRYLATRLKAMPDVAK